MSEIGAFAAKNRFPELLRRVRKGERFTITYHGRPVAELVPTHDAVTAKRATAIEDIRAIKKIRGVTASEISRWVREGRK